MSLRFKKFISYYKPYLGLFLAVMTCALVVSAISLALPLFARTILNRVLTGNTANAMSRIYWTGGVMLALVMVHTACNMFVSYRGHMMGAFMEKDMRNELFGHYQKLSFRFHDEQKTGQLMTRLTNDLFSLTELYHHGPEDILIGMIKIIGAFVILVGIDVKLTLAIFLFLPFMAGYALYFNKKMNMALRRNKDRIGDINAQAEDSLSGIRVVKSFANEEMEMRKFAFANDRFIDSKRSCYKSETWFCEGMVAFTQLITVAALVIGGAWIVNGSMNLADLLIFMLYIGNLVDPIQRFTNVSRLYQEGITGFDRVMEFLEVEPDIGDSPAAVDLIHVKGKVSFVNVGFRYHETYDHVLKNITFEAASGESIAIVGASGAGKTTLCSLIPRFYDVSEGEIRLDGINVKDIRLLSLRRNVGIVQQDVYLFAGTILDNIRYGKPDAGNEEIIRAAKNAYAHDFIMDMPDGYDTDIGQRGVKLSGGQKQRLSIARVFLKDPPILVFDEATSALDNESERIIQNSLETLAKNRTTFIIAHRLSTIRNAKKIVVLSDRGIDEQGTHEELMALGGTYAQLYNG